MIGLGIKRTEGESWLECALRYAKPHGLGGEVRDWYDRFKEDGEDDADAALHACIEWDVADLVE